MLVVDLKSRNFGYVAFVEHSGGERVVAVEDERPTRFKPADLGCYVVHANKTDRGLAKERLRRFWENQ